jgi:hypothetical protein
MRTMPMSGTLRSSASASISPLRWLAAGRSEVVARDHDLAPSPMRCQEHLHLARRRVLALVQD